MTEDFLSQLRAIISRLALWHNFRMIAKIVNNICAYANEILLFNPM